ncbi:biotin--protein ligase isoform X2 [Betta splendens]|uniref:Biotin--protein ligase isoform X2 n=1 Tax=Betta splendens TaxID=158456 RepID=A0A6P7P976_BETSP|nr:biotin--protein ligase isoform X2 [Betta splendens]
MHQTCDDLSKWTVLLGTSLVNSPEKDNISFIIEATGHRVGYHTPHISAKKVLKWSDYCLPLACSPDHPFRALAQASLDNFSRLGVAFIEDRLQLDNGLLPSKIVPIVLQESTLSELMGQQCPQSSNTVKSLCSSHTDKFGSDLFTDIQHPQCSKTLLTLEQVAELGSTEHPECPKDSEDHFLETYPHMEGHGHHLHLSSCHECLEMENSTITSVKHASAENIPDLPNENSVRLNSGDKTLDEHEGFSGGGLNFDGKPPNVLVYTGGSQERFNTIFQVLSECINMENNIIYSLQPQEALNDPWLENTRLLVLAEEDTLTPQLQTRFLTFLSMGGRVLGLASKLCPAGLGLKDKGSQSGQVRRLSFTREDSTEVEFSVLASGKVYVRDTQGGGQVELWGELREDLSDERGMAIVRVTHGKDGGEAVLCQVHLEIAPHKLTFDDFDELKASNSLRIEVLTEILVSLGLSCEFGQTPDSSPVHLLAISEKAKANLLKCLRTHADQKGLILLSKSSLKIMSCAELQDGPWLTDGQLALVTDSSEAQSCQFSMETYRKNLKTKFLGHTLLYADIVTSTMDLLQGIILHIPKEVGLIAIAARQTQGKGRGRNTWLSPPGCAMFTLKVQVELTSRLGRRISFLQHLAALAVVEAVCSLPGYEDIDLRVKWPNDIYYSNLMKLGGVLVTSTVIGSTFHLLIGCGVNVTNSNPTICINDLIQHYNIQHNCSLQQLSCAQLIARTVSWLEDFISRFQQEGPDAILPTYYKRWLHSGTRVHLWSEDGLEAEVVGLDHNGFLQVYSKEHGVVSVEPDGNSFDMLKNLVITKHH